MARRSTPKVEEATEFMVQLKGFADYEFSGLLQHSASGLTLRFAGTMEYVGLLESFFDCVQLARQGGGRVANLPEWRALEAMGGYEDELRPTFIVRVPCGKAAAWQGSIQWVERKKTHRFGTALELILLMEEALGSVETGNWE